MNYVIGHWQQLGWVALKMLLLFVVAALGLRLSERRTLAQLNVFDFVVTVAVGAIVGRAATSSTTSFITGAVALVTLLAIHRAVAALHRHGRLGGLLDRRPLLIVRHGELRDRELGSAGLTHDDALRLLRQAGVHDLTTAEFVLYEQRGGLSLVRRGETPGEAMREGLREAGVPESDMVARSDSRAS